MKFKSIFISDLHIGSKKLKAEQLLKFLKTIECENLFLVGDILDMWSLSRRWYFPTSHLSIVKQILSFAKQNIHVIYIKGNHDPITKYLHDFSVGDIKILDQYDYYIKNTKFLVIHGDQYDVIMKNHEWIARIGDYAYEFSVWLNNYFNIVRRLFGMKYWSLSKFLKNTIKGAVKFIFAFERSAIENVKSLGYDGIICGHIHAASLYKDNGIIYANSGDWTETMSWIAETHDGKLQVWEWNDGEPVLITELQV